MSRSTVNSDAAAGPRSRRHYVWATATASLIVVGAVVSVLGAGAVARNETDESRREFESHSKTVASTMQLAIQHQEDLVVDAGGLVSDPNLSQTGFTRWADTARVLERYPELSGIGVLLLVKDADLAEFGAKPIPDALSTFPDGIFAVVPPGVRPSYCLSVARVVRVAPPVPPGYDFCVEPALKRSMFGARDTGTGTYLPWSGDGQTLLTVLSPIYRDGTPDTVAGRRAAFVGWVGTWLDPTAMLVRAMQGSPDSAVELRFHDGVTDETFSSGNIPSGAESASVDLNNGWTVTTFAVVHSGGIFKGSALALLLGGIAVSVLLGLLMFVLGTGRERARRQLVQRTGQLHHQALHDALTGLPNRALVMDRVEQMLARDRRHHTSGALLFMDIDDFKNVNDSLGHGAGDRLLIAVTDRLSSTLRGVDTVGRMGGDEFVVVVDGDSQDVAPELVAQRLLDVMRQPFELDDLSMPLTVNISIGIATGDRASAGDLLRDADVALYQAKGAGKNRYETFDPEMQTSISRRTDLEFDLRSALAGGQYRLVYQPIYDLEDLAVIGVEALLRWDHPLRGLVGPDEFIPILEQTGQIREVGRWVLDAACRQMASWHASGDTLDISVNVSARQLDYDGITDDIRNALLESGLPASALIIEVTETALMTNVEATARRLEAIKALGVRIAVDDFGTGYSSLAYLHQFPVDSIKIDRAFTNAITTSPESRALVNTLVQLGKDLGLSTLAEGVETTDEMDLLRGADVNQAQGFLMGRPLDPETFETTFLEPNRQVTVSRHDVR